MSRTYCSAPQRARQLGVGMVETMVGILIGMIVIVVVFNVLSVADGFKRATVGESDAQITGLLSHFVSGRDAGNGGAGITMSGTDMGNCTRDDAGALVSAQPTNSLAAAIRPIPVLVADGGANGVSDSFIAYNAGSAHVMWPVDLTAVSVAGAPLIVQSPNGFTVPLPSGVTPYWAVAMSNDASGRCKLIRVTAAVPDPTLPLTGKVTLTQDPGLKTGLTYTLAGPARLFNLGPDGQATRIQYDVAAGVLRTTNLLTTAALTPVPIAQNIVLMKVQYGIDNNGDGSVDCWTSAVDASACSNGVDTNFGEASVRGFTVAQLNRILAVRIGVVVRSDEPDLRLLTNPGNAVLQAEARGLLSASRPQPYFFNCSANTNAACQGRIQVPMGAGAPVGSPNCAPNVICDYWRYRTYEAIVPIRNAIFSATMPP